jgi:hypothetical protein
MPSPHRPLPKTEKGTHTQKHGKKKPANAAKNANHKRRCGGQFSTPFWGLGPGHSPDISHEKHKAVIKLLVAATVGCQGAKN